MIPITPYEYLREHLGCKFSIAEHGTHKRKWQKGDPLQLKDLWDKRINMCQELPNEITLESDYKDKEQFKNKENQDHAEAILQKAGVGYHVSSHKGKSDYVRFRFKTSKPITTKLRLEIIRYLAKPGLNFDEGFRSTEFVRPIPERYHWKHSYEVEKVLKIVQGTDLDIDALGIVEPVNQTPAKVGSIPERNLEPKGWAKSLSIKGLAESSKLENCPLCNTPFQFNDKIGWFRCNKCNNIKGGIKKFAVLILRKHKMEAQSK